MGTNDHEEEDHVCENCSTSFEEAPQQCEHCGMDGLCPDCIGQSDHPCEDAEEAEEKEELTEEDLDQDEG